MQYFIIHVFPDDFDMIMIITEEELFCMVINEGAHRRKIMHRVNMHCQNNDNN